MKKLLIILGILVLLIIGVLFVPPIYNRFTKPFFKNTVDAKEWYHQVDCENLTQVRDYCDRRGYSTDYYILVDFSKPSGKKRFFIYDLQRGKRVMSSYCMHGSGKGNTAAQPKFSNNPGSGMHESWKICHDRKRWNEVQELRSPSRARQEQLSGRSPWYPDSFCWQGDKVLR